MNKQIELERNEMSEILAQNFALNHEKFYASDFEWSAHCLQMAGFHKPEWISVEDDTPKNSLARVQVFLRSDDITDGIGFPKIDTDRYIDGKWVRWGKYVTHWMPLPEAPKKGDKTDA
jgi:hypothetical protein